MEMNKPNIFQFINSKNSDILFAIFPLLIILVNGHNLPSVHNRLESLLTIHSQSLALLDQLGTHLLYQEFTLILLVSVHQLVRQPTIILAQTVYHALHFIVH